MVKLNDGELTAKRQSAAYITKINQLGRSDPDMEPEAADRIAIEATDQAVYGFDAKKDRKGNYIPQGIGAPGRETSNHFASILRYHGRAEWEDAVREIWKRDPARAEKLRLPKLPPKEKAA